MGPGVQVRHGLAQTRTAGFHPARVCRGWTVVGMLAKRLSEGDPGARLLLARREDYLDFRVR